MGMMWIFRWAREPPTTGVHQRESEIFEGTEPRYSPSYVSTLVFTSSLSCHLYAWNSSLPNLLSSNGIHFTLVRDVHTDHFVFGGLSSYGH
jgi:hypothetical protein